MAKKSQKFEDNIAGKYYVSRECICCTLCAEIAPGNFKLNTDEDLPVGHDFVYKQPGTEEEEKLCAEAMDICPANAIGDDGDR
jgi:ferredoxin